MAKLNKCDCDPGCECAADEASTSIQESERDDWWAHGEYRGDLDREDC